MIEHLDPVPFTIDVEAHMGLSEVQGILSSDGTNLVIEYQTVDTMIGLIKTELKEMSVPMADILMITYERKWFGMIHRIRIRSRRRRFRLCIIRCCASRQNASAIFWSLRLIVNVTIPCLLSGISESTCWRRERIRMR